MDSTWMATANDKSEMAFRRRVFSKYPGLKGDPDELAAKVSADMPKNTPTYVRQNRTRFDCVLVHATFALAPHHASSTSAVQSQELQEDNLENTT